MDVLYKGASPPANFDGLATIETGVSEAALAGYFSAGRASDENYNIIVKDGATIRYWYPPAPPAPVINSWDAFDFKARFTPQERIAIRTAAKSDASVEDFLDMLDTAGMTGTMIKANDAMLNAALDALEFAGLLAPGRKAEILGA